MRFFESVFHKFVAILGCLIVYLILILFNIHLVRETPIILALVVPISIFVYYLGFNIMQKFDRINIDFRKVIMFISLLSFVCMVILALKFRVEFTWDYGQIHRSAYIFATTSKLDRIDYYARYPNNQMCLIILTGIYKLALFIFPDASTHLLHSIDIVFNCCMILISSLLLLYIANCYWGMKRAFLVYVIYLLNLPLWLYSTITYTDTIGLTFILLLVTCYIQIQKHNRFLLYIFLGLLSAFVFKLKASLFIISIAIFLDLFFKSNRNNIHLIGSYFFSIIIGVLLINSFFAIYLPITTEDYNRYEFPLTHWVMMSLNTTGGYIQEDVDYTASFNTKEEKNEANLQVIKERVKSRGTCGTIKHILFTKVYRTWTNGSFASTDYISRSPVEETILHQYLVYNSEKNMISKSYMQIYYCMLLQGIFISFLVMYKRKNKSVMPYLNYTFVGLFVFLLIWECNSRYVMSFLPILILLAANGVFTLKDYYRNRIYR